MFRDSQAKPTKNSLKNHDLSSALDSENDIQEFDFHCFRLQAQEIKEMTFKRSIFIIFGFRRPEIPKMN